MRMEGRGRVAASGAGGGTGKRRKRLCFYFSLPLLVPRGSTSGASTGDLQPRKPGAFSAFILIPSAPWTMERVAEGMLYLNQFL